MAEPMTEVTVRAWSYQTFACYVPDGSPYGRFVGTESTRHAAYELGRSVHECTGMHCGVSESARVAARFEHASVRELGAPRETASHGSRDGLTPHLRNQDWSPA